MSEVKSGGSGLPDKIDLHPAGYELDCLLAERVLGATVRRYKEGWSGYENVVAPLSAGTALEPLNQPLRCTDAASTPVQELGLPEHD